MAATIMSPFRKENPHSTIKACMSALAVSIRLKRVVAELSSFTKVQRVTLIVFDNELSRSPGGIMQILHKVNTHSL
jgi:hypothetical protein